jgi:ABC-type multidrug transport system ATPase subunit
MPHRFQFSKLYSAISYSAFSMVLERIYLPRVSLNFARSGSSGDEKSRNSSPMPRRVSSTDHTRRPRVHDKFALSWHNVTLTHNGVQLLNNVSGRMRSGTVSAIVSSDQAATVALLETLSDRGYSSKYKHLLKLDVRLNDRVVDTHQYSYRKRVTYLPTGDAILPVKSTVREALMFHAKMSRMSARTSARVVDKILSNLKLKEQQNRSVAELTLPEKARARVGIALVSRPAALLLDTPLFGLDVYEAYQTLAVLKQVAVDLNIAVLISIDQPSSEVLFDLDDVIFISKGSVMFSGPPEGIVQYFYQLGYSCPPSYLPSDFLLFLFEVVPAEEHHRLVSSWQWNVGNSSSMFINLPSLNEEDFPPIERTRSRPLPDDVMSEISSRIQSVSDAEDDDKEEDEMGIGKNEPLTSVQYPERVPEGEESEAPSSPRSPIGSPISKGFFGEKGERSHRPRVVRQFSELYKRELRFVARSFSSILIRLALFSVLCVLVSLMLFNIGNDAYEAIMGTANPPLSQSETDSRIDNYYGAIAVMVMLSIFGQVEGISVTIPAIRSLFSAEHSFADFYGAGSFFVALLLIELPITFVHSAIQVTAAYWIVGFHGSFGAWLGIIFCTSVATSSVGWVISTTSKSPLVALQLIPIVFLPQLLFSGLLADVQLIPSWLNWLEYLCYLKYCLNLAFLAECKDFLDLNPVPSEIARLAEQNSISSDKTQLYVGIVLVTILGCRLISAFALWRFRTVRFVSDSPFTK